MGLDRKKTIQDLDEEVVKAAGLLYNKINENEVKFVGSEGVGLSGIDIETGYDENGAHRCKVTLDYNIYTDDTGNTDGSENGAEG